MLRNIFHEIYVVQPIWVIPIIMLSSLIVWAMLGRAVFRMKNKLASRVWLVLNIIILLAISYGIVYRTLLCRESLGYRVATLLPFHTFIDGQINSEYYRLDLMNAFLFFPIGLSLPFILDYFDNRKKLEARGSENNSGKSRKSFVNSIFAHPVRTTIIFSALFSLTVEVLQFITRVGEMETDDLIFNTIGGALGCLCYLIARKKNKKDL